MSETHPKGLFGGLAKEFKTNEKALIARLSWEWSCGPISSVEDVEDWHRGGAETYVARSRILLTDGSPLDVIAKAFVGVGLPPTKQQERWEARRDALAARGVPVPRVYAQYPAMTVEEFIPDPLPPPDTIGGATAFQLGQIARILNEMGHNPIALHADVRVKNGIVTVIDFGSDLGGVGQVAAGWEKRTADLLSGSARSEFLQGFAAGRSKN